MKTFGVAFVVMAAISMGSVARAAPCSRATAAVDVVVREAPLITRRDLSLADLQAMAAQLGRPAFHPVLGLYAGAVGYKVRDIEIAAGPSAGSSDPLCPRVLIHADLVAVDRRIVVASDLSSTQCLLGAALEHYRRHAEAAHVALQEFASVLPSLLGPSIDVYVNNHAPRGGNDSELRAYLDQLMDKSVATFTASLAKVQASVDSPDEVHKLITPCEAT